MTVAFTQNPDFSVNVMGTFVENGVTTTFVNEPGGSIIVGGSLFFGAKTVNVNGNAAFQALGHLNPAATQLTNYGTTKQPCEIRRSLFGHPRKSDCSL